MTQQTSGRAGPIAAATARLRMVQFDFADEEAQVREEYIAEALELAISSVPSSDRAAFLAELLEAFPSWDTQVDVSARAAAAAAVPKSTTDQKELSDWSFLVSRLIKLAPALSEEERQVARDRLAAAGLAAEAGSGPGWREDVVASLRKQIGLREDEPVDATRLVEGFSELVQTIRTLDQVAWKTWREIAPRSKVRGPANFQRNLARFAAGDPEIARGQIAREVGQLRQLVAALILAIRKASGEFANRHLGRISAPAIMKLSQTEGKKLTESWELKYWKKYCELTAGLSQATIEREIMDAIAAYADQVMEGTG